MLKKLLILFAVCFSSLSFADFDESYEYDPFEEGLYRAHDPVVFLDIISTLAMIGYQHPDCLDQDTMFFTINNVFHRIGSIEALYFEFAPLLDLEFSTSSCNPLSVDAWREYSGEVDIADDLDFHNILSDIDGLRNVEISQLQYIIFGALILGIEIDACNNEWQGLLDLTSDRVNDDSIENFDSVFVKNYFEAVMPKVYSCTRLINREWNWGAEN